MKILPFILVIALIGCSCSKSPAKKMAKELPQWIPTGTSLVAARQIMEQHQYVCSVVSYDNVGAINNKPHLDAADLDAVQWTQVYMQRSGESEPATNISILRCDWTDSNDKYNHRHASWLMINNKTYQLGCETKFFIHAASGRASL